MTSSQNRTLFCPDKHYRQGRRWMRSCSPPASQERLSSAVYLSRYLHGTSDFGLERQVFFFIIPSLELISSIKPIRNVMAFAVDHQHIVRPAPSVDSLIPVLPVDFCVVKRTGIVLYSLRESLSWVKVGSSSFCVPTVYILCDCRTYHYRVGHSSPVVPGRACASPIASDTL